MMKKIKSIIFFFTLCMLLNFSSAKAAKFYVENAPGKNGQINVSLDTEGEDVNAVDLTLSFDPSVFTVQALSDGNSMVNFWIEKPVFSNSTGKIHFAGTTPGGFTGKQNLLTSVIIKPIKAGRGSFTIADAKTLLNDGNGTSAKVSEGILSFDLLYPGDFAADIVPPESFTPVVARNQDVFDGNWFLSWSTTDKGSGIDHYEVMEVPRGRSFEPSGGWVSVESPYLLTDQSLRSDIYVRAIDRSGNFLVAKVPAANPFASENIYIISSAILLLLILAATYRRFRRTSEI